MNIDQTYRFFSAIFLFIFLSFSFTGESVATTVGEGCWALDPCDDGFTCHPFLQQCYHSPRREGQPCMAGYECGSGLTCEAGSQKCRAKGKVGDSCHLTRPCGSGLNCQPGVHKCYNVPRKVNQPCSAGYSCGPGLMCEAGSQKCRAKGKLGDSCHATRPCGSGLNCQPGVHKCYDVPRKENQPCSAGYSCASGLMCEAGSQICHQPAKFGESCHATRQCTVGLSCQPGVHKCYDVPRKENQPCSAGYSCASGLMCEAGSHICRQPAKHGESCHATRQCAAGLSCQPGVHKCYNVPRQAGEPCSAGYECGNNNFECKAVLQKCYPKDLADSSDTQCAAFHDDNLAKAAKDAKTVMSYGVGSAGSVGGALSDEIGTVYGPNGEFGCYATGCFGGVSDASISNFVALGLYSKWSDFEGLAYVTSEGVSFPFIEVGGFTTSQVLNLKGSFIGSVNSISFGVGVIPVQVGLMSCATTVADGSAGIAKLKASLDKAAKDAKAASANAPTTVKPVTIKYAGPGVTPETGPGPISTTSPGGNKEQQCFDMVQGKVAYNQAGDKTWNDSNIRRLCKGSTNPTSTISCFSNGIKSHNDWSKAIADCGNK